MNYEILLLKLSCVIIIPTEPHAIDFLEPVHITHGQVCSDEIDNVPEETS